MIALDSNVIDLMVDAAPSAEFADAMEAMEPPPEYGWEPDSKRRVELEACYWLLSLGFWWRSTLYTFSDLLYEEIARAPAARLLTGFALEAREPHPAKYREVDLAERPAVSDVMALGIHTKDAIHVADAVALGCAYLLTTDRQLRNKSEATAQRWGLHCRRPSEFLIEAVRDGGAPWPTAVPWPWQLLPGEHASRRSMTN